MPSSGATRHMKTPAAKKMADNMFGVGASFRTFVEMQNALHLFAHSHSKFYMRDARTLNAAKKTTPNIVEKASKDVKYSCLHAGRGPKPR